MCARARSPHTHIIRILAHSMAGYPPFFLPHPPWTIYLPVIAHPLTSSTHLHAAVHLYSEPEIGDLGHGTPALGSAALEQHVLGLTVWEEEDEGGGTWGRPNSGGERRTRRRAFGRPNSRGGREGGCYWSQRCGRETNSCNQRPPRHMFSRPLSGREDLQSSITLFSLLITLQHQSHTTLHNKLASTSGPQVPSPSPPVPPLSSPAFPRCTP